MLNFSFISPEYWFSADLPVFLFSDISLRTFCFSLTNFLLSFIKASFSAFSLLSPSLKASLLGFSSSFFGFSGGTVSRVTSFLFQLKVGRGLRGGYSFLGRAGGFFSSCLGRSCSNLERYSGCSASGLVGSTKPFSTSSLGTYLGIIFNISTWAINSKKKNTQTAAAIINSPPNHFYVDCFRWKKISNPRSEGVKYSQTIQEYYNGCDGQQSKFRIEIRRPPQQQVEMDFKSLSASTVGAAVHRPFEERTLPLPKWHKIQHSRFPLKLYTFTPKQSQPLPLPVLEHTEQKAEEAALTTPKKKSIFKEEVTRTNHAKQDSQSSYHASKEEKEIPRRKKARRARRKKAERREKKPAQVMPSS